MSAAGSRILLLAVVVLFGGGCGSGAAEATLDQETFIAVYVDLRRSALQAPEAVIGDAQRDEVLARHGVTEEALLEFVDVHGRDTERMASVWAEVERRLAADRATADSAS